jgi:CheY-like chemotaxis protein
MIAGAPDDGTPRTDCVHLLLVEDDDGHAMLITEALRQASDNLTLQRVTCGDDALHYLRGEAPFQARHRPNLVLLDMKLPGKSGLDVLSVVKQDPSLRGIPVAILTTSNALKDRQRAYQSHANAYLVKPTDFDGFRGLARAVCAFWGQWNQAEA